MTQLLIATLAKALPLPTSPTSTSKKVFGVTPSKGLKVNIFE
jgi:hypothetical protein